MPELPEVETVTRTLAPLLCGRRIEQVDIGAYTRCIAAPDPASFAARIAGRMVTNLARRGKFIVIGLDSGDRVTVHLRMTGELAVTAPDAPIPQHTHLVMELSEGDQLRYTDVRKFGRWSLLSPDEYEAFSASLGAEPLDPLFTPEQFRDMLWSRKRILKPLLLDQTFITGIGNIYADEALFRARIHPGRRSHELSEAESVALYHTIRNVLTGALAHRGTTLRNYRDGNGQPGENLAQLRIYSRNAGDPCDECGNPVARLVIGQRGTMLCPVCQALPQNPEVARAPDSSRSG